MGFRVSAVFYLFRVCVASYLESDGPVDYLDGFNLLDSLIEDSETGVTQAPLFALRNDEEDDLAAAEKPLVRNMEHWVSGLVSANDVPLDLNLTGRGELRSGGSPEISAELQSPFFAMSQQVTTPQPVVHDDEDIFPGLYDDASPHRVGDERTAVLPLNDSDTERKSDDPVEMVVTIEWKRQRLSSSQSTERGMTIDQKDFCLTLMIADKDRSPTDLVALIQERFPEADGKMIRNFRTNTLSRTSVVPEMHKFLLKRSGISCEDIARVVQDVGRAFPDLSKDKVRGSVGSWALNWMQYCIWPLRDHRGPESDICYLAKSTTGNDRVYLSNTQAKEVLKADLQLLRAGSNVRRRIPAELDYHHSSVTRTTIAPDVAPHSSGRRTKAGTLGSRQRQTAHAPRVIEGISDAVKRICLKVMIDDPDVVPTEGVARVSKLVPGVHARSVGHYFGNLARKSQVPSCIHQYLLERNATEFQPKMVEELKTRFPVQMAILRETGKIKVRMWIKYCIVPLLQDPTKASSLCGPDRRSKPLKHFMRLSIQQRRAFFTDILADLNGGQLADNPW